MNKPKYPRIPGPESMFWESVVVPLKTKRENNREVVDAINAVLKELKRGSRL